MASELPGSQMSTARFAVLVFVGAVWLGAALLFFGSLLAEHADAKLGYACPVATDDSAYDDWHWGWAPPGVVCERPDGDVGPAWWRTPAAVVLLACPIGAGLVWRRRASGD